MSQEEEQQQVTAKAKNINREAQIHAKVDGKKIIISEATIIRDLKFKDEGGVDCLSNEVIFDQLPLMGLVKHFDSGTKLLMYPRFVQVFLDKQVDGMSKHNAIYVIPSHTKKVFSNMRRVGKEFSSKKTPLFPTMLVPAQEEGLGEGSTMSFAPQHTPILQPSTSKPKRNKRLGSQGDRKLSLVELMEISTNLQQRVIDLENTKSVQAQEILSLRKRVKRLEKKRRSRTHRIKRLYKIVLYVVVESSAKEQSLGEEDASKQGRNIADIDAYAKITLVDETAKDQGRIKETISIVAQFTTTDVTPDELTMAQALVEIKKSKPMSDKVVIEQEPEQGATTTTTVTIPTPDNTRPKARGVVMQEPSKTPITTTIPISSKVKDKGKGIMVKETLKMKKKDQISFDEQEARRLQAEIDEQDRLTEEKAQ
nr:hypothetical protein [Tanacetum cinerariifolium]